MQLHVRLQLFDAESTDPKVQRELLDEEWVDLDDLLVLDELRKLEPFGPPDVHIVADREADGQCGEAYEAAKDNPGHWNGDCHHSGDNGHHHGYTGDSAKAEPLVSRDGRTAMQ